MQKTWGIYKGFNPKTNPLNKWIEPICCDCKSDLIPWIDWWSYGCIGFCEKCNSLSIVKSTWIPSPQVHSRAEIDELVRHDVVKLDFRELNVKIEELLTYHKHLPLNSSQLIQLDNERKRLSQYDKPESYLIQHLIWSLIFNSVQIDKSLIREYIEFVFRYPHYYKMYDKYEIWIGHEIDIAIRLEKEFKKEMIDCIYEIWKNNNKDYTEYDFKSKIGFYIPHDDGVLNKYDSEFSDFAKRIRQGI